MGNVVASPRVYDQNEWSNLGAKYRNFCIVGCKVEYAPMAAVNIPNTAIIRGQYGTSNNEVFDATTPMRYVEESKDYCTFDPGMPRKWYINTRKYFKTMD